MILSLQLWPATSSLRGQCYVSKHQGLCLQAAAKAMAVAMTEISSSCYIKGQGYGCAAGEVEITRTAQVCACPHTLDPITRNQLNLKLRSKLVHAYIMTVPVQAPASPRPTSCSCVYGYPPPHARLGHLPYACRPRTPTLYSQHPLDLQDTAP